MIGKIFSRMIIEIFFLSLFLILIAIFLLSERADLTASTLLQRIRGEIPQLHLLRLASAAISTRE